jgi:hypothetical protein
MKTAFLSALLAAGSCLGYVHTDYPSEAESEQMLRDYVVHQTPSQNKIRDHMLQLTPLGSTPQQVLKVITDVLHKTTYGYKKNYYTTAPQPYENGAIPENRMIYVAGNIGIRYEESRSWFSPVGTNTDVVWYFDKNDHLFNVIVQNFNEGP